MTKLTDAELAAIRVLSDQGAARWRRGISRGLHADVIQGGNDLLQVAEAVPALTAELSQAQADAEAANDALDGNPFATGDRLSDRISNALAAADAAVRTCNEMLEKAQAELDAERIKAHGRGVALSETMAELAALRAGAPEREDAAAKAAKALFGVTLTKVTAAPQPPAQAVADFGYNQTARRILSAIDARSEAEVKAEELREAANIANAVACTQKTKDAAAALNKFADGLRDMADRLEREGA